MTIAPTLQKYLADHGVAYDLVAHPPTESSLRTAETCHIPGDRLAKGILLRDPPLIGSLSFQPLAGFGCLT